MLPLSYALFFVGEKNKMTTETMSNGHEPVIVLVENGNPWPTVCDATYQSQ